MTCDSGELALGLKFAPSGSMKNEVGHLRKKTELWAEYVRTGHIKQDEAWMALQTTIMRTIEYALPATMMTRQQLDYLMKPVLGAGLSRSGVCRNMSRTVVFTPNTFQGLGLHHPYDIQGIRKIEAIFDNSQPFTTKLVEASWYRAMIESGQGADFLETDITIAKEVVTDGWILSLWQFLYDTKITLRRNCKKFHRELRSFTDSYIMNDLVNSKIRWSKGELEIFNNCRRYLRVELVSDITTADGTAIRRHIWNGTKDIPYPSTTAWTTWKKIIKQVYNCNDSGKLQYPREAVYKCNDWKWFWDKDTERIYCKAEHNLWNEFSKVGQDDQYDNRPTLI
jgi:hypothetical protein